METTGYSSVICARSRSPRTDVLGNFQSSLRDWSSPKNLTQHYVQGYYQPSLRDCHDDRDLM
jgi:hypothetical protein